MEMVTFGHWYLFSMPGMTATVLMNAISEFVKPGQHARIDEAVHKDLGVAYQAILYIRVMSNPLAGNPKCVGRYKIAVIHQKSGSSFTYEIQPFYKASAYVKSAIKDTLMNGYIVESKSGKRPPKIEKK